MMGWVGIFAAHFILCYRYHWVLNRALCFNRWVRVPMKKGKYFVSKRV